MKNLKLFLSATAISFCLSITSQAAVKEYQVLKDTTIVLESSACVYTGGCNANSVCYASYSQTDTGIKGRVGFRWDLCINVVWAGLSDGKVSTDLILRPANNWMEGIGFIMKSGKMFIRN